MNVPLFAVLVLSCTALVGCGGSDTITYPELPGPVTGDELTYAGSAVCRDCHASIYASWSATRHTKKVRVAGLDTVVNDADNSGVNDFVQGGVGLAFDVGNSVPSNQTTWDDYTRATGIEYPKLGWDGVQLLLRVGPNTYPITYVLGGTGKWKQRYMMTIGSGEYISPVQYNDVTREYVPYHPEHWYTMSGSTLTGYIYSGGDTPVSEGHQRNSWQRRCTACHTTGLRDITVNASGEYGASIAEMLSNVEGPMLSELPVSCEACHGPSSRHVALGGGLGTALNPDDLSADRGNEVCGSCHNRGASQNAEGFGYPWAKGSLVDNGFQPGDILDDFFVPTARDGSRFWDDGAHSANSHRQQFLEHETTPHGRAGVTCWKCHDPHGAAIDGQLRMPVTQLCLSCHDGQGDIDGGDLSLHTGHKDTGTQACSNCHMIETAKSAINYDIPTHTYRVIFPAETAMSSGVPNSCGGCHAQQSVSELTGMLRARFPDAKPVAYGMSKPNPFGVGFLLDGSGSIDPLGGSLTYQWTYVDGPPSFTADQLLGGQGVEALFVPSNPGVYTFYLVVTNHNGQRSNPAHVKVDVSAGIDQGTPDLSLAYYVGSINCSGCHRDIHDDWMVTRHTQKVRRPFEGYGVSYADTDRNEENDWMQDGFNVARDPRPERSAWKGLSYRFGPQMAPVIDFDDGTYTVTIGPVTYDVTWLLGGTGKWKQRYMATIDEGEYILPIQFNDTRNQWVVYHLENWYTYDDANGNGAWDSGEEITGYVYDDDDVTPVTLGRTGDSWQRRCTACHATGARDMTRNPDTGEYAASIDKMLQSTTGPRLAEPAIGCEACHGPGSEHVRFPTLRGSIINPTKLSSQRANEVCASCHNRGVSEHDAGFGFPWSDDDVNGYFIPGMDLSNYFESVDEAGSRFWSDPFGHADSHRQQWLDMRWTAHFKEGGMTCMSCHLGHDASVNGQLKMESNALCLNCHTDIATGGDRHENHDRHYPDQVRCVDCHMRFVAKSAVEWDIHSHSFQIIYPEASEDSGIPNSCERCHDEEDPEEIQEAINELWGALRPRAEPRVIDPSDGEAKRSVSFNAPKTVTLDGTKSYDPNGRRKEIVTFAWSILSTPSGSAAELSSRLLPNPTVTLDLPGTYVFSLVVTDARQTSKPATIKLVVD